LFFGAHGARKKDPHCQRQAQKTCACRDRGPLWRVEFSDTILVYDFGIRANGCPGLDTRNRERTKQPFKDSHLIPLQHTRKVGRQLVVQTKRFVPAQTRTRKPQCNQFPCPKPLLCRYRATPHRHKTSTSVVLVLVHPEKIRSCVYYYFISSTSSQGKKNPHCPPLCLFVPQKSRIRTSTLNSRGPERKRRGKGLETSESRDLEMIGLD
jgi:hypothetical protein